MLYKLHMQLYYRVDHETSQYGQRRTTLFRSTIVNTQEIATKLVELCKTGQNQAAIATLYATDIVSYEATEPMLVTRGIEGVKGKNTWWTDNHTMHSGTARGPWINGEQFVVEFTYDVTPKATGVRTQLNEAALYTVRGGKIVEERFFPAAH